MKHYSLLLLVLTSFVSNYVVAQDQSFDSDVDAEIDQIYNASQNRKMQVSPGGGAVVTQTIMVPQQQQQQSHSSMQKQPTTVIEASPLSDSRADMIRKGRQEEEMRTETKIVEKLEQSRMEDEKKRAAVLFGDKFETLQNSQNNASMAQQPMVQQQVQQQAPVQQQVVAPAPQTVVQPVYVEPRETLSREAVREEVRAALTEDEKAVTAPVESRYFAGLAGIGEYPDASNVRGNYSLGAAFGTRYDYLLVEGAFMMSNYSVDMANYPQYGMPSYVDTYDVNQYQGSIAAKYQLLGGVVRPVLGGLVAYSYRKFTLDKGYSAPSGTDTGYSHAIDFGINTGVDFEFSPKFSMGVDFKYMFNMSSRVTSNYSNSSYTTGKPIEKMQYYIAGIAARVNF